MKTVACPDCAERVRPCNLARHRKTHIPIAHNMGPYVLLTPPKRPLLQYRTHDRRYDEAFPRGEGMHRVRIYRLRGGELQLIATASGAMGTGVALFDLHARGAFIPDDSVGVQDTKEDPGTWIVHPFALGRTRQGEAA